MINITVYHNSHPNAIAAAAAAMCCIQQQIDTRIVNKGGYSPLLPDWLNLRKFSAQLCHVEVTPNAGPALGELIHLSFQRDGFESKIAIVIQHHDDPVSRDTAQFIRWRLSRLINPHEAFSTFGVMSPTTPPCLPIVKSLQVNYATIDMAHLNEPNGGIETPTAPLVGHVIPTEALDHTDYIDLYGLGQPIDRLYLQHPMACSKSVCVSFVPKDDGYLLCASQFDQTSYQNQARALYLTQTQVDKFFAMHGLENLYIATGDTPIDLFYEMLYLYFSQE